MPVENIFPSVNSVNEWVLPLLLLLYLCNTACLTDFFGLDQEDIVLWGKCWNGQYIMVFIGCCQTLRSKIRKTKLFGDFSTAFSLSDDFTIDKSSHFSLQFKFDA